MASPRPAPRRLFRNLGLVCATGAALSLMAGPAWAGGTGRETPTRVAAGQEQSRILGTPTLTAQQRSVQAAKDRQASTLSPKMSTTAKTGTKMGPQAASARTSAAALLPSHRSVKAIRQHAQERTYWCGPATLVSLVQASKVQMSQTTAAGQLRTTSNGTNWYAGSGNYPMERALDRYSGSFNYSPVNLSYTPSRTDKDKFKQRLIANVATHGQGIAGNAWEVPNGPHLNGHPNRTIYHWIPVRGYDDAGMTTRYADSVAGSSIGWGGVPAYNEIPTDKIVTIFGGRGYIW